MAAHLAQLLMALLTGLPLLGLTQIPAGTIYDEPPSQSFLLPVGGTLNQVLGGWLGAHVIVDNFTNQYLELDDTGRFIGPGEHAGIYPLPGVSVARAHFAAPPGYAQPPNPIGVATLVFLSGGINAAPTAPVPGVAPDQIPLGTVVAAAGLQNSGAFTLPPGTKAIAILLSGNQGAGGNNRPTQLFVTGNQTATTYGQASNINWNNPQVYPIISVDDFSITVQITAPGGGPSTVTVAAVVQPVAVTAVAPIDQPIHAVLTGRSVFNGNGMGELPFGQQLANQSLPVVIASNQGSIGSVDVTDRAGRLLGAVSAAVGALWDVSDRAARLLGVADVSDRAGRLLGVVASITAAVDISDRAARLVGRASVRGQDGTALSNPAVATKATCALAGVAGKTWTTAGGRFRLLSNGGTILPYGQIWDGASGGTLLFKCLLGIPATIGAHDEIDIPRGLKSSVGNALTFDFDVAGPANTFESISAFGWQD